MLLLYRELRKTYCCHIVTLTEKLYTLRAIRLQFKPPPLLRMPQPKSDLSVFGQLPQDL